MKYLMKATRVGCLIACWQSLAACAPDHPQPSTLQIIGGYELPEDHPAQNVAVGISHRWRTICSGIALSNKSVLTAAHCADKIENLEQLRVHFDEQVGRSPATHIRSVIRVKPHPEFLFPANDLAILTLAEDAPFQIETLPIAAAHTLLPGDDLELVGYGLTSEDRRTRTVGERLMVDTLLQNWFDEIDGIFISGETPGKSGCQGDSGGPVFKVTADGERLLAGIISGSDFGTKPGDPGCMTGRGTVTAIDTHWLWLKEQLDSEPDSVPTK